jgi:hypothetical protein
LLIEDELAMRLEGSKTGLQGSQHRYGDIRVVTSLKSVCNNFTLASDAVLAFGDVPIGLG